MNFKEYIVFLYLIFCSHKNYTADYLEHNQWLERFNQENALGEGILNETIDLIKICGIFNFKYYFTSNTGIIFSNDQLGNFIKNQQVNVVFDNTAKREDYSILDLIRVISPIYKIEIGPTALTLKNEELAGKNYSNFSCLLLGQIIHYINLSEISTLVKELSSQSRDKKLLFLTTCFLKETIKDIQKNKLDFSDFSTKRQPAIEAARTLYRNHRNLYDQNKHDLSKEFEKPGCADEFQGMFFKIIKENQFNYYKRYHPWKLFFAFAGTSFGLLGLSWLYKKYGIPMFIKNLFYKKK